MGRLGRPKGTGTVTVATATPIGTIIRKARLTQQLGLREVASACKVSVQFISNIEHGRAPAPIGVVESLIPFLNLDRTKTLKAYFLSKSAGSEAKNLGLNLTATASS